MIMEDAQLNDNFNQFICIKICNIMYSKQTSADKTKLTVRFCCKLSEANCILSELSGLVLTVIQPKQNTHKQTKSTTHTGINCITVEFIHLSKLIAKSHQLSKNI